MIRQLWIISCLFHLTFSAPLAHGGLVLLSASRGAGASGYVADDDDFFSDGSGNVSSAFGGFSFAGGVRISEPQGSVDGFAMQTSDISPDSITMFGSADANVSSGTGEFDYASGGGNSSLDVTFRTVGITTLDINYSGGGFPSYVEPYFLIQQINGPVITSYYSGSTQEVIDLAPGQYVLSTGISAGVSASYPGDSGSAFGSMSLTIGVFTVPEASSVSMALVGMLFLAIPRAAKTFRRS